MGNKQKTKFDRTREDVGNIVHLEHVNVTIPDQGPATLFYLVGLQLTRDPFMFVGLNNMWVNVGRCQVHMPRGKPQRLRGTVGLVTPDLDAVAESLKNVKSELKGTKFAYTRKKGTIEATCPWGNTYRVHEPAPEFGDGALGIPYLELDAPAGSAKAIAKFYEQILGAPAVLGKRRGRRTASVMSGPDQWLHFMEARGQLAKYDGHHFQIYLADFSGPYAKLMDRGLITRETDQHEWRFQDIVDLDSNKPLLTIEHEVRSMLHPLRGRPMVNRNPAQNNRNYVPGQDHFPSTY